MQGRQDVWVPISGPFVFWRVLFVYFWVTIQCFLVYLQDGVTITDL